MALFKRTVTGYFQRYGVREVPLKCSSPWLFFIYKKKDAGNSGWDVNWEQHFWVQSTDCPLEIFRENVTSEKVVSFPRWAVQNGNSCSIYPLNRLHQFQAFPLSRPHASTKNGGFVGSLGETSNRTLFSPTDIPNPYLFDVLHSQCKCIFFRSHRQNLNFTL